MKYFKILRNTKLRINGVQDKVFRLCVKWYFDHAFRCDASKTIIKLPKLFAHLLECR